MGNSGSNDSGLWRTATVHTDRIENEQTKLEHKFTNNSISTSKYTLLTFLPKSLSSQFARLANVYFLIISLMMMVGTYTSLYDSPLTPWTTLGPLSFVLMVSVFKEGLEDWKRHKSDDDINNSIVDVMRITDSITDSNIEWIKTKWKDVRVGDIVKILNNHDIPSDLILLSSTEEDDAAYIETANIDGETNLKIRNVANTNAEGTGTVFTDEGTFINLHNSSNKGDTLTVEYETPNPFIHTFTGTIDYAGKKTPVDQSNVLLRGATLRNTNSCIGACVYTGSDTKIIQNSRQSRTKLANIDKTVNTTIYLIMCAQCVLSALTMVGYMAFENRKGGELWYLCYERARDNMPENTNLYSDCSWESSSDIWGYFFTFFILYNNFIPISLYVTVEMCNYAHAHYIDNDMEMYDEKEDVPAAARTSNLGSDLGQVEYIFSDKTGTLTQNVMRFQKASVEAKSYSMGEDLSDATFRCFPMNDLKEEARAGKQGYHFVACLGLCHTIVLDKNEETGEVEYKAESPDEEALVSAAANLGFSLVERSSGSMTIDAQGIGQGTKKFKVHATIPFDSARKRMSVMVEDENGKFILYVKGADNIMLERSKRSDMTQFMNQHLSAYASEGLRTLVLGKRDFTSSGGKAWLKKWNDALSSTVGRAEKMEQAAAEVETNVDLVGATAIEDALQEDVANTIADLMKCGIKLWVLTGDKMETAINIGYSCKVLQEDMTLIKLQAIDNDPESVKLQLQRLVNHFGQVTKLSKNFFEVLNERTEAVGRKMNSIKEGIGRRASNLFAKNDSEGGESSGSLPSSGGDEEGEETVLPDGLDLSQLESQHMALIVDGPSLAHVLGDKESERMLLQIATICKAVIACRVSPSQKALIVKLVKKNVYPMPMTLAIGDGANDVGMIQEAHVGVGISGKEGRQAVNSSDFAIAQFRFLRRLIMVHGRWNYRRLCKCILYSFYKNIVLTFMLFFFEFFAAFSGKSLFEDMVYSGYNFFLGMPPLMIGMFDKDMSQRTMLRFHKVYMSGRERMDLNVPSLASWMSQGVVDAILIYFLTFCVIGMSSDGMYIFGTTCYSALILSMMYRAGSATFTWNAVVVFFWIGSIILYAGIFLPIYSNWYSYAPQFYGVTAQMSEDATFWLILLLVPTCVIMLDLSKKLWRSMFVPTIIDHAIEVDRGITHDVKEMIQICEGDEDTIRDILKQRGEFADDGMYKWWTAFNSKLPKFKFDRNKLRLLNRKLDKKSRKELGIVDTETDGLQSGFVFDHVSKDIGVGGTGGGQDLLDDERFDSGDSITGSLRGSFRESFAGGKI
ncbi:hypothetical protein TrLO_g8035 [Triparma laevis f. longispina]|uniref:Phospholipid-transporting ATPase n=1 Tax=Triparma laevis f. longispina TaxID=1714387 RepID=A0A9W7F814_9STRA|nr:hypothetical protein TrLO_g8035 [Triparma laevis f. longispina]